MNIRTSLLSLAMALVFGVTASIANAQPFDWSRVALTGQSPSPRVYHAMAYDSARGVTVLFGGNERGGETWEWNGFVWTQRLVAGPPLRWAHAMVYDSARGVTVLFGGTYLFFSNGIQLGDTWEWDGITWTQRIATGPTARSGHGMAFDSARGVTVLFGGVGFNDLSNGETWEWNGTVWSRRAVGTLAPAARKIHAMAYDAARHVTVLFGGITDSAINGETWEWDGTSWTQRLGEPAPRPRILHSMVYDTSRGVILLVGGAGSPSTAAEAWEWDGLSWTERAFVGLSPLPRYGHAMAYDAARGVALLSDGFGNGNPVGDTWTLGPPCVSATILVQPQSVTTCRTTGAVFSIAASGTGPIGFAWRKSGIPIDPSTNPTATTDTLSLPAVQATDAGSYDCVVSSPCGSVASNPATLSTRLCVCLMADVAGGGADGLDGDGIIDGSDFIAFINSFAVGDVGTDPRADVAGGGLVGLDPDGVIDGTDFIVFINVFSAGC